LTNLGPQILLTTEWPFAARKTTAQIYIPRHAEARVRSAATVEREKHRITACRVSEANLDE
jgi:hypothetical protein